MNDSQWETETQSHRKVSIKHDTISNYSLEKLLLQLQIEYGLQQSHS
jgi:hypothetical protein